MKSTGWLDPLDARLRTQLEFLAAIDQLKLLQRDNLTADGSRRENPAEHSWHLAMFAVVLSEYAIDPIDISRVVLMVLIHDLVEVDTGDSSILDEGQADNSSASEMEAARRVFGRLPDDQEVELFSIWEEFEHGHTSNAKFARALDRFQPLILNHSAAGGTWVDHSIDLGRLAALTESIAVGSDSLWRVAKEIFADGVANGWLRGPAEIQDDSGR